MPNKPSDTQNPEHDQKAQNVVIAEPRTYPRPELIDGEIPNEEWDAIADCTVNDMVRAARLRADPKWNDEKSQERQEYATLITAVVQRLRESIGYR